MRRSLHVAVSFALLPALSSLAACGTSGKGGAVQGTPNYFVMPEVSPDITNPGLMPAINDYGPEPLTAEDCAPPPGVEITLVDDYELGLASKSYTYNDSTGKVLPIALKDWEPVSTPIPAAWGGNRCGSTQAMHFAGYFTNFGAGFGTVLYNHDLSLNQGMPNSKVPFRVIEPYWPGDMTFIPGLQSADLSAWDGITFWARRNPFAGPGFRPGILDKSTADDFNQQLPPEKAVCRTIYTLCSCQNQRPCTAWDPATAGTIDPQFDVPDRPGTYCWDPAIDRYPSGDPTLRCGQTACNYRTDTPKPTLIFNPTSAEAATLWMKGDGAITCSAKPYVFKDSTQPSGNFCYRPGIDLDPAEKADRCQDGFLSGTALSANWKRYMIPFADLRQGSVSQRSPGIDLTAVEAIVFAFAGGNLDVWIDDVGFYRKSQ